MVELTVSFEEIVGFVKKNNSKPSDVLESLACDKNLLSLTIPRKDAPAIPAEVDLNFSANTFVIRANSGEIKSLARITFSLEELLSFLKASIKKSPFLETMTWNDNDQGIHLVVEPEENPEGQAPFQKQIELLLKLAPCLDEGFRLRIADIN